VRSILVIRLSSLGDVILTTPIVRQLAHSFPMARIDVVTAERFADVWQHNPYVHTVWPVTTVPSEVEDVKLAMLQSLSSNRYDMVVDLQSSVRSSILHKGLCETLRVVPKYRLQKLAMVWLKRFPRSTVHVVDRYREALANLPLAFDVDGLEVWTKAERDSGAYEGAPPTAKQSQRIAIAPGAHHATKRWPPERFAELCGLLVDRLNVTPVIVGATSDTDVVDAVIRNSPMQTVRADGATTLDETIRILDTCSAIVTNDSGVMHLASARRLPVVAIFGSTVTQLGFSPFGVPFAIAQADVACRPCSHIGKSACPRKHFRCMLDVTAPQVLQHVIDLQI